MTDRPIIFSGPMVEALVTGRKTQTRRLATSPLRRCAPGDRLWVKEAFAKTRVSPIIATIDNPMTVYRACDPTTDYGGPWKPSIHMPRALSRITLTITHVKTEPLQAISDEDAVAEGIAWSDRYEGYHTEDCRHYHASDPVKSYASLWDTLHGDGAWLANPEVVALAFTAALHNIDTGSAP